MEDFLSLAQPKNVFLHLSYVISLGYRLDPFINSNHNRKPANTSPDTHRAHPAIPAAHALRSSATDHSNLWTSGRVGGATALNQAKSALFPMVMNNPCSRWLWVVVGVGVGGAGHTGAPTCCSGSSLSCIRTCF